MKKKQSKTPAKKIPKVRIARPDGRPYQLRYTCPLEKREVRISVGGRDEDEAARMKAELEAKLLLGLETRTGKEKPAGPDMEWDDFREQYRALHLTTVRNSTTIHAESRLDLAERILRPKTLADVADPNALQRLQAKFLAGEQSRRKKPRSTHTVRGYMNSVLSAVNWAYLQGWLPTAPKLRKIKTPKQKVMMGRPITGDEFRKMLDATAKVVGDDAAESWKHVLRGLWASALRLDEIMHVSWEKTGSIRPAWKDGQLPVLEIPAAMQKNDTEENIPLLPWFEAVLMETPQEKRKGWVFNPETLQRKLGRKVAHQRPDAGGWGRSSHVSGKRPGSKSRRPTIERDALSSTPRPTTSVAPAGIDSGTPGSRPWSSAG